MKRIAQTALTLLLGMLFLYAAMKKGFSQEEFGLVITKVFEPIEFTEWVKQGLVWAVVLTEGLLGTLLVMNIGIKRTSEALYWRIDSCNSDESSWSANCYTSPQRCGDFEHRRWIARSV